MTAPEPTEAHRRVMEALSGHRYRDVLGDYETPPHYRHFGCSCGAEWNIAGMSGWRSWVATYEAHLADVILAALGADLQSPAVQFDQLVHQRQAQCESAAAVAAISVVHGVAIVTPFDGALLDPNALATWHAETPGLAAITVGPSRPR